MRLILAALLLIPFTASAHMAASGFEYPARCCSGQDCAEIPAEWVDFVDGKWEITIPAGGHPMVQASMVYRVADERKKIAPDGRWHICIVPPYGHDLADERTDFVQCFFGPGMGV